MEDNNTIIFRMGEETGIVIEKTKEQFEHSPFKEQYRQAFSIVDGITIDSSSASIEAPVSNIVAFCGDRGEGKTSALMTIRQMLVNEDIYSLVQKALNPIAALSINPNEFYALDMIDPSFFDDKHNILELVLGQMYEMVNRDDDSQNMSEKVESGEYRPLMEKFAVAKNCLSALETEESMYDAISELSTLAANMRLRKSIDELFATFLAYYKKKKLIISIDDIDLNMKGAYEMTEDIRKYLSNNHCIILMAVKVDQLTTAIRSAIRRDIPAIKIVSDAQIADMAHKYISKLIPENNRVVMPSPDDIVEKIVILKDRNNELYPNINNLPAKEIIVRLIFNKTRFLFYNSRSNSPIVPLNLRSIRHLISILVGMSEIYEGEDSRNEEKLAHNKNVFKNYFYQSWVGNLSKEDKEFALQLATYKDVISTNKFVVSYLAQRINIDKDTKIDALYNNIVAKENRSHNISVGDVYYVIRQIEMISTEKDINTLLFFVRSYYSMRLYELYDVITRKLEMKANLSGENNEANKTVIYKYDTLYEGANILQKFLNGSYFSYAAGDLINDTDAGRTSLDKHRDCKLINGEKLGKLIHDCNELFPAYQKYIKEKENRKQENEDTKKQDQQWKNFECDIKRCEYFILTTTHQLEANRAESSRIDNNKIVDKTAVNPPFIGKYDNIERKYLAFNFLSLFYNLVNLRYAFKRFGTEGDNLFQNAITQDWSLTSQLFLSTSDDKTWPTKFDVQNVLEKYHKLLSDSCIRVSEVQQSIVEELTKNKLSNKNKNSSDNTYKLYSAYEDIQKLDISLYPYSDAHDKYRIKFDFLTPIIAYLKEEDLNRFNEIYSLESSTSENSVISIDATTSKSTVSNISKKAGFYDLFPSAHRSKVKSRYSIIRTLCNDQPGLANASDEFWKDILPEISYSSPTWKKICAASIVKFYPYL